MEVDAMRRGEPMLYFVHCPDCLRALALKVGKHRKYPPQCPRCHVAMLTQSEIREQLRENALRGAPDTLHFGAY